MSERVFEPGTLGDVLTGPRRQIVMVALVRGDAEETADYWRKRGHKTRVYPRTVRAEGLAAPLYVVVTERSST